MSNLNLRIRKLENHAPLHPVDFSLETVELVNTQHEVTAIYQVNPEKTAELEGLAGVYSQLERIM